MTHVSNNSADKIVPHSTAGLPKAPEKSIAVLPFDNLSGQAENAFFANGVQDEILTHLAKIADLKVISRTSVMSYMSGVRRNVREIRQQLGVAHLLRLPFLRKASPSRESCRAGL